MIFEKGRLHICRRNTYIVHKGRCRITAFLSADKKSSLFGYCAVNSEKSATKSELVGRSLKVLDLKTSCQAIGLVCGGPRKFVRDRARLNQLGNVTRQWNFG